MRLLRSIARLNRVAGDPWDVTNTCSHSARPDPIQAQTMIIVAAILLVVIVVGADRVPGLTRASTLGRLGHEWGTNGVPGSRNGYPMRLAGVAQLVERRLPKP